MRHVLAATALSLFLTLGCHKEMSSDDEVQADAGDQARYTITWGPVTVAAGTESTQCIWVRLPNTGAIKVHQMHNSLSSSSHHLIVYKDDMDTAEQTTPTTNSCQPFAGALNTSGKIMPLAITQKKDDVIELPSGVAYDLDANQMIKVEMHYLNASDADEIATATVEFVVADPATIHDAAGLLFAGSPDISIPAGQPLVLHQFLTMPAALDLSASHIFAITGHTHKLGTNVQVNVAPTKTGPMTPVYAPQPFQWAEPLTQQQSPDFAVPKGGGFDFTCSYNNTTTQTVKFGESATDEMCFFWAYYWPSQGSRVCVHTEQLGGKDLCCPGDSLCSFINL